MNDKDQLVAPELNGFSVRYDPTWLDHDSSGTENQPADFVSDLVSLRYLKAALRRGIRLWCALAIVGMLVGIGYKAEFPAPHQASTTILLPQDEQAAGAILTDVALAQSRAVAGLAVRKLGLTQSAESFSGSYTVIATTGEVLVITATGPSATEAVRRANALADVFLTFRANLQVTEQEIAVAALDQELSQARDQIHSLNRQISDLSGGPASAANQARLSDLRTQLGQANDALATANGGVLNAQQQTTLQLKGSKVLDPAAAIPKSRKKPLVVTGAIGLFAWSWGWAFSSSERSFPTACGSAMTWHPRSARRSGLASGRSGRFAGCLGGPQWQPREVCKSAASSRICASRWTAVPIGQLPWRSLRSMTWGLLRSASRRWRSRVRRRARAWLSLT